MSKRLQTPLAHVRGLGSAKDGTHHWWWQRLTALALVPLTIVFLLSVIFLVSSDNEREVAIWLTSPFFAVTMVLMLAALFYHARLGMQVIIEDYIHNSCLKSALLVGNSFIMILFAAMTILAVLKLHLGYQLLFI